MQALAEVRMPDDAERSERTKLFTERFRHWVYALFWIVEVERCTRQDAFFKLGDAISCGDLRAGTETLLLREVIHDRLAQEFAHIFIKVEAAQSYAKMWRRPELVTYIFWEDLLRRWPQKPSPPKPPSSATAGDEKKAVDFLVEQLEADQYLTRDRALEICRERFPKLTERGFRFRVWPKAREGAGLEPIASPGRKPNRKP
jgi:hypothetical protein